MKGILKPGLLLAAMALISCASVNNSGLFPEDELFVTRKYVGNFIEGSVIPPKYLGDPFILNITTSLDTLYGTIAAYSSECGFTDGDRLYIRRIYQKKGVFGSWVYYIENDGAEKVLYQIREFRNGRKVLAQSWF